MFWVLLAAFITVVAAHRRRSQGCPAPFVWTGPGSIDNGLTYSISDLEVQGFATAACPFVSIELVSSLNNGFAQLYYVPTDDQYNFNWIASANGVGYIYPGPYTLNVWTNAGGADNQGDSPYTSFSITIKNQCPSMPQFSGSLTGTQEGWPGLVLNGTAEHYPKAPCDNVELVVTPFTGIGSNLQPTWGAPVGTAGSSTVGTLGSWSAQIFPSGSARYGVYQLTPTIGYNTPYSISGTPVTFGSPQCNTPVINSINTNTPFVSVLLGSVYPGCETYTATFSPVSGSTSYSATITQVTGPNIGTLTLVSPNSLPSGEYTVSIVSSDPNLKTSNPATSTFTLNVAGCALPTFTNLANGTAFHTVPTLQGSYASTCPTVTFSITQGTTTTSANGQVAGGSFTWQPPLSGNGGSYIVTVTSCGSLGPSYCSTIAAQIYYFPTSCDVPALTSPLGTVTAAEPSIAGTFPNSANAAFCDQLQLFWIDPAGQQMNLPVTSLSLSGVNFQAAWNGSPLPAPGTYTFWVKISSAEGKIGSISPRVTANLNIPTIPACSIPTISAPSTVITSQTRSITIGGTFDPRCNSLWLLINGQIAAPVGVNGNSWQITLSVNNYPEENVTYALSSNEQSGSLLPATSNGTTVTYWAYVCGQPTISTPTSGQVFGRKQAVKGTISPGSSGDCTVVNTYFDNTGTPSTGSLSLTGGTFAFTPNTLLSSGSHQMYVENVGTTGRPGYTFNTAPAWIPFTVDYQPTVSVPAPGGTYYPSVVFNGTVPPDWGGAVTIQLYYVPSASSGNAPWREELIAIADASGVWSTSPSQQGSQTIVPGTYTAVLYFYQPPVGKSTTQTLGYNPTVNFNIASPPAPSPTSRKRTVCPAEYDSCPLVHARGGVARATIECVPALKTNLERCGSCDGPDCTALSHVNGVDCVGGQCIVRSCLEGFNLTGNACRPDKRWNVRNDVATPIWNT